MIRKVPNYLAWVGKCQDVINNLKLFSAPFFYAYSLPLFGVDYPMSFKEIRDSADLILLTSVNYDDFSLDFINEVNKIWNEFYD